MNQLMFTINRTHLFYRIFVVTFIWLIAIKTWVQFGYHFKDLFFDAMIAAGFALVFALLLPTKRFRISISKDHFTAPVRKYGLFLESRTYPLKSIIISQDFCSIIRSAEVTTANGECFRISSILHGFRTKKRIIEELQNRKN